MPLYEYLCTTCNLTFEIQHKMADPQPTHGTGCPRKDCCLERQISIVTGIVKSPNPMTKAVEHLNRHQTAAVAAKPEPKSHQCGTGCALHSR